MHFYRRLGTPSRRAIVKTKTRSGQPYYYRPRGDLLQRLSAESGLPVPQVLERLMEDRAELLRLRS